MQQHRMRRSKYLLDQFVSAHPQGHGEFKAERRGGLQVDDQLDFSNLLDRQVGGLLALEDTAGVDASRMERIRNAASVAYQAASRDELAKMVDRGYCIADSKCCELLKPATEECIGANHEPARW